ncbi:tyrosine phenol-lyase [candidate division KSB3 bacterium]|uniref:Tryptophanase n=1 Tax=candidate division KSB3 bacterium TaxID=2044937 RepID=A0A2G6E3J7_9BACT|nr:MAG: tyrosine phenol-lyase [candidate division KSB3 bacterium]PIE29061.1 MAG: tyrosine phenol-lyase [candidate division KSB3 bacterium]
MGIKYVPEPFRIKVVETIKMLSKEEREQKLAEAKYNMFNLKGEDVYIDLLTDSGTNAMSQEQWAGIMRGDEAYAGASSYFKLLEAATDITGYTYIQPVHQGRAAEKVLFGVLMGKGEFSISNMHFDTTRAHVELSGARAIDCVVPEAGEPLKRVPFKGNMDLKRLESLITEHGPDKIALVIMTITNNSAGGQPVSMENIRETSAICKKYGIKMALDAARYAENAFFIKEREEGYAEKSIKEIVSEMFSYADMFTMSAKKDTIVNMGGLFGIKEDEELFRKLKGRTISFEGFTTYGGLAGRDLEALAIGLYEGIDENYLRYRIGQMEYLAARLDDADIAYQSPVGGHGVFVDAKAMFPHIPYYEFPGQALAIELYREAGIRTCDIGSYMLGNDPDTGEQLQAQFEFTRLAVPRRVYTQAHIDVMADALLEIKKRASEVKGYEITWEPPVLRHFQAFLTPLS